MSTSSTPPKNPRVTISDVARLSGATKATVSKALDTSSRYGLTDDLKQRVIAAAQQLGYEPRGRGRANRRDGSHTVALLYSGVTPPTGDLYPRFITGAVGELQARQCEFIHLPLIGDPNIWKQALEDRHVSAGLVIEPLDQALELLLRGIALPRVLLNIASELPVTQVITEVEAGAAILTKHLIDLGHRRITICTGTPPARNILLREEGFRSTMRKAGLQEGTSRGDNPAQFSAKWAELRAHPTAVITDTLATAIELLHGCWANGIRVPQDLSIASLEDAYPAELLNPPLTAMRIPAEQLGREAASLLLDQLEGEQSSLPRKILFTESLIIRQSVASLK